MHLSYLLLAVFRFLLPPALIGTTYLYLYPFFQQCGFPEARPAEAACYFGEDKRPYVPGEKAPFRLLALADPQLEGDTSIPDVQSGDEGFLRTVERVLRGHEDWKRVFQRYRKELDLWGNDLYLAHVVRTMRWYTDPTHVVVLGDLLGSQWIDDQEFQERSGRFWDRVFKGMDKVPRTIADVTSSKVEALGKSVDWKKRVIAVAGNHDVGYAGDLDAKRMERFEDTFGRANWEIRFRLNESSQGSFGLWPSVPELRLVILNSMNLDEPALDANLQEQSVDFINQKLYWELPPADAGTILLTHIPLHKQAGICIDGPFFSYFDQNEGGGIKEQNHLSYEISERILDGLIGPERTRKAIILNGHDHHGCHLYHSTTKEAALTEDDPSSDEQAWHAHPYTLSQPHRTNTSLTGVREITVRSMMGEFGGNAGLLSAWWDDHENEWKFEYASCMAGVQHIWWAVHVLDIVVIALGVSGLVIGILGELLDVRQSNRIELEAKKKKI